LSFNAMAQTLVQIDAPPDKRGRLIGLFKHGEPRFARLQRHFRWPGRQPDRRHWSLALSALATLAIGGALLALP
jgi:hypothetical protein